jgi:hypothetical protein
VRPTCMRVLLVLPLLLVTACGSSSGPSDALPATSRADDDLVVQYDAGDGSPVQSWTLTCVGSVEGSHPQAEQACARLKSLEQPFAPLPADRICTQQYGGPQTATVTGLWRGEPVDVSLSRVDGCVIAQWDSLVPLVPAAS